MSSSVLTVHVLTDDKARKRGFLAEHGLSLLIEYDGRAVLFDTGQSDVYLKNAARLKKDPAASDAVVISHGHYDHCGGLEFFPYHSDAPKIYISEKAFESKFARNNDGTFRDVGIPKAVRFNTSFGGNAVLCDERTEIFPGVSILGGIENDHADTIKVKSLFVERADKMLPDSMEDEQMLVIRDAKGLSVFLGCSHPGIVNCITRVLHVFPGENIRALFAGMHLESADDEELEDIMDFFAETGIERLLPLHCTGIRTISAMKDRFKDQCMVLYSGDSVTI